MIYQYLIYIISALLIILIFVKTYLFFSGATKRNPTSWFYFTNYAVFNSRNEKSRKSKLLQNRFTWIIICLVLVDIIVLILYHNL